MNELFIYLFSSKPCLSSLNIHKIIMLELVINYGYDLQTDGLNLYVCNRLAKSHTFSFGAMNLKWIWAIAIKINSFACWITIIKY